MVSTGSSFSSHVIGSNIVEISGPNRTGVRLCLKISTNAHSNPTCKGLNLRSEFDLTEGPSCLFVGPLETASKETLEALYFQAREAYYSGRPLIVDDMFDRVELKLRRFGSKSVIKYPRCSIRRQSTYADAEEDPSQVFVLGSVWIVFFAFGSSACLLPIIYTVILAYQKAFSSEFSYVSHVSQFEILGMINAILFMVLGFVIGYPITTASSKVLQCLWKNELVALSGACPNCGEEVFAFVRSDHPKSSHRANCHVCECCIEFRTKVEQSVSRFGRNWVHGRIYLVSRTSRTSL